MMMGGPSQRRSWADLAEGELRAEAADLQWEDVLGRGPVERVALSDSEDYPDSDVPESPTPPPQGKGKSVMETAGKRQRARRHHHSKRRMEGFMVAVRRSHPAVVPDLLPPPPRHALV